VAPSVVQQIDEALHPEFVTVLRYSLAESRIRAGRHGAGRAPAGAASPRRLP
jgi:hypothetical protein